MPEYLPNADWLEFSGLPAALNGARANAWLVFKMIVELDCRENRHPAAVEISPAELAERTGLALEAVIRIVETLRKKKLLKIYLPEHPDEEALFEVVTPIPTPLSPEETARRVRDPHLRDTTQYRYASRIEETPADVAKIQKVVDLYLTKMSQKMNSFVLEQIEVAVRRFSVEDIERLIERAQNHEIRAFGWILKELIREQSRKKLRQ